MFICSSDRDSLDSTGEGDDNEGDDNEGDDDVLDGAGDDDDDACGVGFGDCGVGFGASVG